MATREEEEDEAIRSNLWLMEAAGLGLTPRLGDDVYSMLLRTWKRLLAAEARIEALESADVR